jgi:type IV pilus assembly protein PilV
MTLIEVLIAAVIITTGLLGVAAMQISALQGTSNADYRSKAIDFATALSDRMHANLSAFSAERGHDNAYLPAAPINCAAPPAEVCAMKPNATATTEVSDCNPTQMAIYDLWEISCGEGSVQTSLPGGRITLRCLDNDTADSDACSDLSPMLITVTWDLQSDENETDQVIMTAVPGAP